MEKFVNQYKLLLTTLINKIDLNAIKKIIEKFDSLHQNNGKIFVIGNGGSAATASHMVNDLGVGLKRRGIRNFNIESLADNVPVCTAIANDIGYENIFYAQLKDNLTSNDILIAISCSGNSHNILKATNYAQKVGATIVGLTGFDGGMLKKTCDISIHVETEQNQYGLVEDIHMILDHILYTYFIEESQCLK
ncbi:MAG: SIS domain-containing protein [Sulfuricurvum sp.]